VSWKIEIKSQKITVVLWDIGGQNLSSKMMTNYVAKADIVFLTYDITNPSSFTDIPHWHSHVKKESTKNPKVYLLANKCDLEHLRRVSRKNHDQYIQEECDDGRHVSARTGQNLMIVIYEAVAKVCKIDITKQDLAYLKKTLVAHLDMSSDEGRTSMADKIEAEDRAAMARLDGGGGGGCCLIC
jgi:Ras-related protein Rab-28